MLAEKVVPILIRLNKEKNIDLRSSIRPSYFQSYLQTLFGNKSKEFSNQIRIEKAIFPSLQIFLIHVPSNQKMGQCEYIGIVIGEDETVSAYTLEWSKDDKRMVCAWEDNTHLIIGNATDKVDFVKKIKNLHVEICGEKSNFSELDLKHRLAKEIGVRYEMLDFYMRKFQSMVVMEMQGIDTSSKGDDIEDEDEWLRYCQWEIEQAKKRMSKEDLEASKNLFYSIHERNRVKNQ